MRRTATHTCLLLLLLFSVTHCINAPHAEKNENHINSLMFQPEKVESEILCLIEDARESIEVSLYGFENEEITKALISARNERGVDIRMSTEFDSESSRSWQEVIHGGIPVKPGNKSGIMHNKYLIFDDKYLLTGSTNLTKGMFRHFNNTIVIRSERIIEEYKKDFEVQYAGYYAGQKDDGYDDVIGGGADVDWETGSYEIGQITVTPFFTPYKKTIQQYTNRDILKSRECPSSTSDTDPTKACFRRTGDACEIVHSRDSCEIKIHKNAEQIFQDNIADLEEVNCYDPGLGNRTRGITYRFLNHDKVHPDDVDKPVSQQRPAEVCATYDHAINVVVQALRSAESSITLLVFAFTDRVIMQELIRAKQKRGVDVRIWMDYSQYRSSRLHAEKSIVNLAHKIGHLKVVRRPNGGLLHHKVIIIDDKTILLGSMNYSSNAVTSNDENFLLLENAENLAKKFKAETAAIDKDSISLSDRVDLTSVFEDPADDSSEL